MINMIVQNKLVAFTPKRIPSNERLSNLFYYELRHDHDFGIPFTVENSVLFDFYGTIISHSELKLKKTEVSVDSYYELTKIEKDAFIQM